MNLFNLEPSMLALLILLFLFGLFLGVLLPLKRNRGVRSKKDARQSSDYIRGMYSTFAGDLESAVYHLTKVIDMDTEPVEVHLALGNLFRKRGQVDKAIRVHQSLLTRAGLPEAQRVLVLDALGMDFRTGGLMDRALNTFKGALALNPKDPDALIHLIKISEDLGEWTDAYDYAVRLQRLRRHKDPRMLSFLVAQKGRRLAENGLFFRGSWYLHRAIKLLPENMVAFSFLAELYLKAGKPQKALKILDRAIKTIPHKAFMVLGLLKETYVALGDVEGYLDALQRLGREHGIKRAMLEELQEKVSLRRKEEVPRIVLDLVKNFERSRLVQRMVWNLTLKGLLDDTTLREIARVMSSGERMMDDYTCVHCGYKTHEILHRCPNCKEWNSFSDSEG